MQKVVSVAYRLNLPERLKLYPTFHASILNPCHDDQQHLELNRSWWASLTVQKEFTRMTKKILDRKMEEESKKNWRTYFLVQWKDLPKLEASWEKDNSLAI